MWPLVIAALGQIGATALGQALASGDKKKQMELFKRLQEEIDRIPPAQLEQMVAEQMGPSAHEGIQRDPTGTQAQYDSLAGLQNLSKQGLSLSDRAALNQALSQSERAAGAARRRAMDDYSAAGGGGSGAMLAAELDASQRGSQQAYDTGLNVAGMQEKRAFDALMGAGRLGGELRGQDFEEKSREAAAKDAIARQNFEARQYAAKWNANLPQQIWENKMRQTQAKAGVVGGLADLYGRSAQQTQNTGAAIGQGINDLGAGYYKHQQLGQNRRALEGTPQKPSAPVASVQQVAAEPEAEYGFPDQHAEDDFWTYAARRFGEGYPR